MRTKMIVAAAMLMTTGQLSGQITAPGVKWLDSYSFDRCNQMKVEFYAKNNELMRTISYKTWFNSGGNDSKSDGRELTVTPAGLKVPRHNFMVLMDGPSKGSDIETIFDMANEVAVQIFGADTPEPMYNAGRFKFPEGDDIKKLELAATGETRTIIGCLCSKYTYTYKSIFGSVWITTEVNIPNDYGIFRAAKMATIHNTLSAGGFVMEMTSEDTRGGKTVMTTVSLDSAEGKTVTLPRAKVGTAINRVNYFTF